MTTIEKKLNKINKIIKKINTLEVNENKMPEFESNSFYKEEELDNILSLLSITYETTLLKNARPSVEETNNIVNKTNNTIYNIYKYKVQQEINKFNLDKSISYEILENKIIFRNDKNKLSIYIGKNDNINISKETIIRYAKNDLSYSDIFKEIGIIIIELNDENITFTPEKNTFIKNDLSIIIELLKEIFVKNIIFDILKSIK